MQRTFDEAFEAAAAPRRLHGRAAEKLMLDTLRRGPISTTAAEADVGVHRGQQVIGTLRASGIRIDTVRISGVLCYVLRDPTATLVKVPRSTHTQYCSLTHWKNVAADRKQFDGHRCVQCHSADKLEVHHWRYELFAEDVVRDLCTLCSRCHHQMTECLKGSGCHFPTHLTQELKDRIWNVTNTDTSGNSAAGPGASNDPF